MLLYWGDHDRVNNRVKPIDIKQWIQIPLLSRSYPGQLAEQTSVSYSLQHDTHCELCPASPAPPLSNPYCIPGLPNMQQLQVVYM